MRKLAAVLLGVPVALLCLGSVASAGITPPIKIAASVYPHHVNGPPYTFTTTGFIIFPPFYCSPGTNDFFYCTRISAKQACGGGQVKLTVSLGEDSKLLDENTTIKTVFSGVSDKCYFSIKTTLDKKYFTATSHASPGHGLWVWVAFDVQFLGTSVLNPGSAKTQWVEAKVIEP